MGIHDGHRQRVKEKFTESGADSFRDHELLEMLLFYGIARKDTNEIAHKLIDKFGSLAGVLSAATYELTEVEGISEHTAALITLVPQIVRRAEASKPRKTVQLTTPAGMYDYLKPFFRFEKKECAYALFLDSQLRPIACDCVNRGVVNAVNVSTRQLCEMALRYNAVQLVLAHNHPDSVAEPSRDDIELTKQLAAAANAIGVTLVDHIIVAGDGYCSLAKKGYL